jgi:hypothetical protein
MWGGNNRIFDSEESVAGTRAEPFRLSWPAVAWLVVINNNTWYSSTVLFMHAFQILCFKLGVTT